MSESEEQENNNLFRSPKSGTIGEQNMGNNGLDSGLNGEQVIESLPYKTCSEYVQHLNVWILQTQYWQWFVANYPLIMSQMASIQTQQNTSINSQTNDNNNNNNNPEIGQ
jgi:hypothetical protein